MTAQNTLRRSSIRAFLLAILLLLGSTFATGTTTAGTLIPAVDMGAPGGGGAATAIQPDDLSRSTIPGIRVI